MENDRGPLRRRRNEDSSLSYAAFESFGDDLKRFFLVLAMTHDLLGRTGQMWAMKTNPELWVAGVHEVSQLRDEKPLTDGTFVCSITHANTLSQQKFLSTKYFNNLSLNA